MHRLNAKLRLLLAIHQSDVLPKNTLAQTANIDLTNQKTSSIKREKTKSFMGERVIKRLNAVF